MSGVLFVIEQLGNTLRALSAENERLREELATLRVGEQPPRPAQSKRDA